MPIIIKNQAGLRRAHLITKVDAEAAVAAGEAVGAPGYPDIYEEVVPEERAQGYATRSMVALTPVKRGPGRPPKARPADVTAEAADEAS